MKAIVRSMSDPRKFEIVEPIGFIPINFICWAPLSVEHVDDLDIDEEKRTASINQEKLSTRKSKDAKSKAEIELKAKERAERRDAIRAIKDTDLGTLAGLRAAIKLLKDEVLDSESGNAADIIRLALKSSNA